MIGLPKLKLGKSQRWKPAIWWTPSSHLIQVSRETIMVGILKPTSH